MKKQTKLLLSLVVLTTLSVAIAAVMGTGALTRVHRAQEPYAEQILHAFITDSREPNDNVAFEVARDEVSFDPNVIANPYTICFTDSFFFSPQWEFGVRFKDGSYYYSQVWKRDDGKWWIMQFRHRPDLSGVVE